MDEEFSDAEIRALVKTAASDRRRAEVRQRLERAGEPQGRSDNGTTTDTPDETPLAKPAE